MDIKIFLGDAHTHELNANCVPDNLTKQQTGYPERFLRYCPSFILNFLGKISGHRKINDFIKILRTDSISEVMKIHISNMNDAGISYSIILLLDCSWVAREEYPIENVKYEDLLRQTAEACAAKDTQFRLFPFFMFDPRRDDSYTLLKESYENLGIVGIKIYPAFGFDPRPNRAAQGKFLIFPEDKNERDKIKSYIGTNLDKMYKFAHEKNLPITTHCSPGGSWLCGIKKKEKHKYVWEYTQPYNFREIAFDYKLRINFAHMAGNVHNKLEGMLSTLWYKNILELIYDAHYWESKGKFYTDKSNGLAGLISWNPKKKRILEAHMQDIQKRLNYPDLGEYFIFGSDWPLHASSLNLKEYVESYVKDSLNAVQQKKYFSENIANFLFGKTKEIPENYIRFLKKMNNNKLEKRNWIDIKNNKYYLKT